jgi:hypothetical protein
MSKETSRPEMVSRLLSSSPSRRAAIAACCALFVSSACARGGDEPGTTSRPTATADVASPAATGTPAPLNASIEINHPKDDATLTVDEVFVSVTVRSFEVSKEIGRANRAGQGLVVFYLDTSPIPTEPGEPALTEDGRTHREPGTGYRWKSVEPGRHTLGVQLVNNDSTPLEPPVTDEITVRVTSS